MSDAQKLKDCITEYRKANKAIDDRLNKIEAERRRVRREVEEQLRR